MSAPLLETRGLRKSFGALCVTDDLDLSVAPRGIHALIGPNGAGKTSLIKQLCGTMAPDGGRIIFAGRDITGLAAYRRARLGIGRGFQITSILPEFSVLENVALSVQAQSGSSFRFFRPAASERSLNVAALAVLEQVGLAARAGLRAGSLSYGEKRQLELALVLGTDPRLLVLDEPFAGAGPQETALLVPLLARLGADRAILLVEHDMEAVFALAQTISVLAQGRLIASGPPESIRTDAEVRRAYLGEETS